MNKDELRKAVGAGDHRRGDEACGEAEDAEGGVYGATGSSIDVGDVAEDLDQVEMDAAYDRVVWGASGQVEKRIGGVDRDPRLRTLRGRERAQVLDESLVAR